MADTLDRLKTALSGRYGIEEGSGTARLTTAQAAARRSVGKPTLGELVASATVSWPSRGFTRGNNGADFRRWVQMNADNDR